MGDILAGISADISIVILLSVVMLWLLRYVIKGIFDGELIPRKHLEAAQNDAKEWKEIALTSQKTTQDLVFQVEKLVDAVEGPRRVVEAMPRPAEAVARMTAVAAFTATTSEGGRNVLESDEAHSGKLGP